MPADDLPANSGEPAIDVMACAAAVYQWACERLYHEFAWSYDGVAATVSLGRWDRWRSSALVHVRGPAVLELGLGTGALLPTLSARFECVSGIELSEAMLDLARARWRRQPTRPLAIRGSALSLPLAADTLDTVVATFPAPYIFEPATLLEIRRVLRPGGRLVVAGLWVDWIDGPARLLRLPFLYGRPSADDLSRIHAVVTAAGLAPKLFDHPVADAALGTLVAHKNSGGEERRHA